MVQAAKEDLLHAGCPECSAQVIEHLLEEERFHDALHKMRVIRCDLMEELHRSQRRVDCLDFLIRQTEKEIKTTTERR
ncbi:MAG: hypothetical protein IJ899_02095 [Blautia sp.]|nr:hypothetical protein [Blautia sp.]